MKAPLGQTWPGWLRTSVDVSMVYMCTWIWFILHLHLPHFKCLPNLHSSVAFWLIWWFKMYPSHFELQTKKRMWAQRKECNMDQGSCLRSEMWVLWLASEQCTFNLLDKMELPFIHSLNLRLYWSCCAVSFIWHMFWKIYLLEVYSPSALWEVLHDLLGAPSSRTAGLGTRGVT